MIHTRIILTAAAVLATAAAPASAHYVTVTPAGGDNCLVNHVGQFPPDHNSMQGHTAASAHERSAAVRFGAPGSC